MLAQGLQRVLDPRVPRHPERGRRRPEGPGQRHWHRLPAHDGADLHRASDDSQQPGSRGMIGLQGRGRRATAELRCRATLPPARRPPNRPYRRLPKDLEGQAKHPIIVATWQRAWENVTSFFVVPPDIRRVIYTTNAIDSLNVQLRKIIKTRGHFPIDELRSNCYGRRYATCWPNPCERLLPERRHEQISHPLRRLLYCCARITTFKASRAQTYDQARGTLQTRCYLIWFVHRPNAYRNRSNQGIETW